MKHAISQLKVALDVATHNRAIHAIDGAADAVNDISEVIADYEAAIALLESKPDNAADPNQLDLPLQDEVSFCGGKAQPFFKEPLPDADLDEPLPERTCTDEEGCTACQ